MDGQHVSAVSVFGRFSRLARRVGALSVLAVVLALPVSSALAASPPPACSKTPSGTLCTSTTSIATPSNAYTMIGEPRLAHPVNPPVIQVHELIVNGGFENPNATLPDGSPSWIKSNTADYAPGIANSGSSSMGLGGLGGLVEQKVVIPASRLGNTLYFSVLFPTTERMRLMVFVFDPIAHSSTLVHTYCDITSTVNQLFPGCEAVSAGSWAQISSNDLSARTFLGHQVYVGFVANSKSGTGTLFLDDVSLNVWP